MKRRAFLAALAAVPLAARLPVPTPSPPVWFVYPDELTREAVLERLGEPGMVIRYVRPAMLHLEAQLEADMRRIFEKA